MDAPTAGFLSICVGTLGGIALKFVSNRQPKAGNNGNGNGKCPLHADIEKRLAQGDDRMDALLQSSRTTRKLVIAIAAHFDVPIGKLKEELQDVMEGD
jgi:hypothetical protein